MWYMEVGVNRKYDFGLSWATHIGLEYEEKKLKYYDHNQPSDPPLLSLIAVED